MSNTNVVSINVRPNTSLSKFRNNKAKRTSPDTITYLITIEPNTILLKSPNSVFFNAIFTEMKAAMAFSILIEKPIINENNIIFIIVLILMSINLTLTDKGVCSTI
ncbi:MAG: hypothetical protein ABSG15_11080 [FCB group bacterium]|jgi:hypothetical protein